MNTETSYEKEAAVALAAVREASRLCRAVQDGIDPGMMEKKDRSPVTVADYGSQALVCRALGEAFPDDPVIAEEDAAALREPDNAALGERVVGHVNELRPGVDADTIFGWIDRGNAKEQSPRYWTLDPIDGTKGFLRKQQYAVALALIIDGELAVAALGCPNLGPALQGPREDGTVLVAVSGRGCLAYTLDESVAPVPVSASDRTDNADIRVCESFEKDHSSHDDAARIVDDLGIAAAPARLDSQAKYAVVARGEAEAYLRLPRDEIYVEKIWDHAAGVLVVTEAGGRVTDVRGNAPEFKYGYLLEKNRGMIVTNGRVHDAIMGSLDRLGIG